MSKTDQDLFDEWLESTLLNPTQSQESLIPISSSIRPQGRISLKEAPSYVWHRHRHCHHDLREQEPPMSPPLSPGAARPGRGFGHT